MWLGAELLEERRGPGELRSGRTHVELGARIFWARAQCLTKTTASSASDRHRGRGQAQAVERLITRNAKNIPMAPVEVLWSHGATVTIMYRHNGFITPKSSQHLSGSDSKRAPADVPAPSGWGSCLGHGVGRVQTS